LKASVLIPTYNRRNDLEECVKSLLSMNFKPYEIIVVDSHSTDGTEELQEIYTMRYVRIEQRNRQTARNVGVSKAEGDVIAFLDDDVVVSQNWLKNLLKPYKDPNVGGVGGRTIPYGQPPSFCVKIRLSGVGKVHNDGLVLSNFDTPLHQPLEVDCLPGCNMSFKKDALASVNGFDENFEGNCFRDDTDLCLRIRKLGYRLIFQPKSIVWHKRKGRKIDEHWIYWYVRNNTYFYLKNIFPAKKRYLPMFFFRQMFPPKEYVQKSEVKVKPTVTLPLLTLKGFVNGLCTYLNA